MSQMKLIGLSAMLAVSGRLFCESNPGEDGASPAPKTKTTRTISMVDGTTREFGEKQRLQKDSGVEGDSVYCRMDFDNGNTFKLLVPAGSLIEMAKTDPKAQIALDALGHGLEQKLGDAAAGAESTEDAVESVVEVMKRLARGEWNKGRGEGGGGSAKGAGELVKALVAVLGKDLETVRTLVSALEPKEKSALRRAPQVAAEIERIRAAQKPSEADKAKEEAAAKLLESLAAAS